MINNQTSRIFLIAALIWGMQSCAVDDTITEEPEINFPDPVEILAVSILGSLEDEAGLPISDAVVMCSNCVTNKTTLSDEKGDFQFLNVDVKGDYGYIIVKSEGKFDAFRRFGLLEGRNNYTRILMKDQLSLGTLMANQGGQLDHANGASIALPANGIVDENGLAHSGEYEVFLSWIDPSAEDLNRSMIGDLSAIAADGEVVGLSTYGMLQVELEAPDGAPLNLKEGVLATLEFPVPESLISTAPTVIPLWSYDEEHGYWLEEGEATLVGDKYVGEVSHFSTWNVDVKIDPVDICGSIIAIDDGREVGLPYFQVKLVGNSFQAVGGWLCEDGSFRFMNVPSGAEMIIEIQNYCGDVIESIALGPFETGKVELDPIFINDDTEITYIEVTGNALDCEGNPVSNGCISIDLEIDSYIFPLESDGSFTTIFPTCGDFEAMIQILDKDGFTLSLPIVLTEESQVLPLDDIEVCGEEPEEYFYYTFQDPIGDITRERYFFNENDLNYRKESTMLGDERYQLSNVNNGDILFDGIGITINMIPQLGVTQIASAVLIFTEDVGEFFLLNDIEIKFTELGVESSPGEFEFIQGHFNKANGTLEGEFRLKFE